MRGRTQTERVWNVIGHRRHVPTSGAGDATPFVGRATQRELMQSVMTMVANGRSAVMSVTGEAGAGKSRLVDRMLEDFPHPRVTVFAGACAPYGENNVWAPIATALFGRLDLDAALPAERLRDVIRTAGVARFGFSHDDPSLERLVEALLHLLGHPSEIDHVSPAEARETMFRLIVEGLRLRSRSGPVVLWLDDLQWADPLLIDLLHRLARSLTDRPVLLLTAQRDDVHVGWPPSTDNPITIRMPLDPLTRSEADELLLALLGDDGGGQEQRAAVRTERRQPAVPDRAGPAGPIEPRQHRVAGLAAGAHRRSTRPPRHRDRATCWTTPRSSAAQEAWRSLEQFARHLSQAFDRSDVVALVDEGLLDLEGNWWRFRSDVVREVSYQRLTKVVRARRHAGVAAALSGDGVGADRHRRASHGDGRRADRRDGSGRRRPARHEDPGRGAPHRAALRSLDVGALNQASMHASRALALGPRGSRSRPRAAAAPRRDGGHAS